MPLDRTWYNTLVDDDGSNTIGTPWTKAAVDSLLDSVDALDAAAEFKTGVQSITLSSGTNSNVTVSSGTRVIRIAGNADGTSTLTGLTGGSSGRILSIFNVAGFNIAFKHLTTSTASNQLVTPNNGVDFTMGAFDAVDLWYDSTNSVWRVKAF